MRIAIVHYHLHTGGVTRVILQAARTLRERGHQVLVLSGEAPAEPLPEGVAGQAIPGLGYEETRARCSADSLATALTQAATATWGQSPDLWHVHNHALGKNVALPAALARLLADGQRLLLQLHDFAEDGRAGLYRRLLDQAAGGDPGQLAALLYPRSARVHYAVINGRDRGLLLAAGFPPDQVHVLPNGVELPPPAAPPPPSAGRRLWLYPTRGIRRKNLGEFLLWAALAEPEDLFATTQAPRNPAEQPIYDAWRELAQELKLPVAWAIGDQSGDYSALLQGAESIVTTSVAEGFGLTFLEPWLLERPLAGRDLPEITADFRADGLDLADLYPRLDIPLPWLEVESLRERWQATLRALATAYGLPLAASALDDHWEALTRDGVIDCGQLDEPAQTQAIRRLVSDPNARYQLSPLLLEPELDAQAIARNRRLVSARFGRAAYGDRLDQVYRALLEASGDDGASMHSPPSAMRRPQALLEVFLHPQRQRLLNTQLMSGTYA